MLYLIVSADGFKLRWKLGKPDLAGGLPACGNIDLRAIDKLEACLPSPPGWLTFYEKNRNPFWSGTQFSPGICRAGKSENGRQRYPRGIRQDRQGYPRRAVRLRRGDRSHLAGRALLSRLAQKRSAHGMRGGEQSVLVERGREIFQQRACDQDWGRGSAHCIVAVEPAADGHK